MNIVLKTQSLTYHYDDGTKALENICVEFEQSTKTYVLGANGAGKSTLFLCLNGILKPKSGDIYFDGKKLLHDKKSLMNLRKNVGIVFQEPDTQLFASDVYKEISFGPMNLSLPIDTVKQNVDMAILQMDIESIKDKPVFFLSYGQKKRVCIADILAMKPKVIIFDEPTACLDPKQAKRYNEFLNTLSENGITLIIATHDMQSAFENADKIIVLDKGTVLKSGAPIEIFSDDGLLQKAHIEKPIMLSIFEEMKKCGLIAADTAIPRHLDEFKNILKSLKNT